MSKGRVCPHLAVMSKIARCAIIFVQALAVWMPAIINITIMRMGITILATIVMTMIMIMIMVTIIIITLIRMQTTRLGRNPCVIAT